MPLANPTIPDAVPAGVGPLAGDVPQGVPPESENTLRKPPPSDPFFRSVGDAAGGPVRAAAAQTPAAVPAGAGPVVLTPPAADRFAPPGPITNSYLAPPPGGDRYAPPPVTANVQEPGRFRADAASAMPNQVTATAAYSDHAIAPPPRDEIAPAQQQPPGMDNIASLEGTGQPGGRHLEGPQSPQLTIEKVAPREVQVGKPATFRISVRNTGQAVAGNVEVRDQIPRGTRLLDSAPPAARGPHGELVWTLGTIRPGEQSSVQLQLVPTAEGEIGSVATVHFDADASARTVATRPKLTVQTSGANRVLVGNQVTLSIVVSNPGTGVASGVVLEEHIPAGLQHPAGSELEYNVGDLHPGESRRLDLQLAASRPGAVTNVLAARGEGNLRTEDRFHLEVVAPQLDIAMTGPKHRYLERAATYQLAISNPGTAPAEQVELVAYLPSGLKFFERQ